MDIETGEEMAPKSVKPKKPMTKKPKTKKSAEICPICRNRIADLVKKKKPRKKRNITKK